MKIPTNRVPFQHCIPKNKSELPRVFFRKTEINSKILNFKTVIGRQTNLFKQNLKSAIDNKANQISNQAGGNNGQSNTLLEMNQSSAYNYVSLDASQSLINNYDVEDSLDLISKLLVKKIHKEFKVLETMPENIVYQNYHDYELGLELIKIHTGNCISFISNISC